MADCIEINPGEMEPQASILWLHGLGADGHDFVPIAGQLRLPVPVRYLFPHAPIRPVTINGGMAMRAWFDLDVASSGARTSLADIMVSVERVRQMVDNEVARGIPSERVLLAGFSQGGAVVVHLALRYPQPLAGLLVLSGFMSHLDESLPQLSPVSRDLPMLIMHGRQDPMIPIDGARTSFQALAAQGYPFEWREYDMPHAVCPEQIADINVWMNRVLARQDAAT